MFLLILRWIFPPQHGGIRHILGFVFAFRIILLMPGYKQEYGSYCLLLYARKPTKAAEFCGILVSTPLEVRRRVCPLVGTCLGAAFFFLFRNLVLGVGSESEKGRGIFEASALLPSTLTSPSTPNTTANPDVTLSPERYYCLCCSLVIYNPSGSPKGEKSSFVQHAVPRDKSLFWARLEFLCQGRVGVCPTLIFNITIGTF